MKIILEFVLIENFFLNLIILKTSALLLKERGKLFWLSALLGGCFTVAIPLLRLNAIGHLLTQMGFACLYVCISFDFKTFKKFITIYLCYFLVEFAYGGAVYFFESLVGQNFVMLVLFVAVNLFVIIKFLYKRLEKKKNISNFCMKVEVYEKNKSVTCKGFLDSGNLLTDPITSQPVCLINYRIFSKLFEEIGLEDLLVKNDKIKILNFPHFINLSTLNNTDKILVFQVEKMCVENKTYEKPILGLALNNFNQAFGSDIILHNSFA